jgi:hypothetical protein
MLAIHSSVYSSRILLFPINASLVKLAKELKQLALIFL